ncbi:hypothetical protein BAUCODRAFT_283624 [Baudoinia panamericana UAMH 10762]|uniref:Adenine deaminase n=1 Tax=Baudoinia panamericana (strain UAMH 10762) TaxID=717646 RepID=M2LE49_BAUPA|nr:uncharacterized protein BAUCODRAFT_283624 [Baudoinia panamericana UAMH 10762]EMC92252.1 hypothetical protein BAUCODRAFT_283624 [Baudoinia panamericana UAMH 10762]
MCQTQFHTLLQALPKCEHHLHLEGALTPETLFALAVKNGIQLPSDDPAFASPASLALRYQRFTSLDDFLHYYYLGMSVLLQPSDFESLAWDYFLHASKDGVAHAELFFDPQAHLARGVPYETIVSGFTKARMRAEAELGISSLLVCCFLRHLPPVEAVATFRLPEVQHSFTSGQVTGIGLDSSELEYPPELFTDLYASARDLGLKRTAHAGEEGPPSYVTTALEALRIERIDHGIRIAEDPSLLTRVADEGILLTVCPISNVFLRCVPSVADLPIQAFMRAGVRFSINSDDPAYFGNHFLLDNYCAVQTAFDLTANDWSVICKNSINGSWCSASRKEALLRGLKSVIDDWTSVQDP